MKRIILYTFILLSVIHFSVSAQKTVINKITSDIITVSPGKRQLQTLGWPNNIINSIAVNTNDGIVLIDTQNSPANAKLIKSAVIDYFNDSTFAYIINTHGHSAHSGGNCIFEQNRIVAHTNSADEIKNYDDLFLGQTVEYLRKKIYHNSNILDTITSQNNVSDSINEAIDMYKFYEADLINNYRVRYPALTFDEEKTLTPGDKTIEMKYMGKGHGNADILVYINEDKTLCTGNLFHLGSYQAEEMPSFYFNRTNDIDHWIKTLTRFLENHDEVDYIISTHGKKPFKRENIVFINEYCKAVRNAVQKAKKEGIPKENIQNIDTFENLFKKYSNIVKTNNTVEEMHARNISIIWQNIE
ncbi:MAG TPA: MBL fold metallo-hydrolase [Prolixibacteraceae bacterium]|nr:MBL fold metallo-hydrolase [Prolixibacteraceae bacterium]